MSGNGNPSRPTPPNRPQGDDSIYAPELSGTLPPELGLEPEVEAVEVATPLTVQQAPAAVPPVVQPAAPAPVAAPKNPATAAQGPVVAPQNPRGPVAAPAASQGGVRREVATDDALDVLPLLRTMIDRGASDLHLSMGAPPTIRINGEMVPVQGYQAIQAESLRKGVYAILDSEQREKFENSWELDFAYTLAGVARFRVNVMKQRGMVSAVFRLIPWEIKPLEALGLPPVIGSFAALPRGLVLVTGQTGAGKSTTLAALVDKANRTRHGHIITIEDPIEFLHAHRQCIINQREVGTDTHSFSDALRHVLRQDPDIILIGELRDLETIQTALTAAETGHLVFATLHTQSSQETMNRIIDVFPQAQQSQIRSQLAATLKGVVSQTLVRTTDGSGRAPAVEILVNTIAIAAMIRKGELHQIPQALQSGGQYGMQTLDQSLASLVVEGRITRETAEEYANDLKELDNLITGHASRRSMTSTGLYTGSLSQDPMNGGMRGSSL